ncbi:MAG: nuclear transport factor 2 family protein [Pseudomonadota bacterium]|nr:nuclear transport factor 2 family protein [Pseudomonadota bacterium]
MLKKFVLTVGALIALHSNFVGAKSPERDYQAEAEQVDASYWAAYNRVDPAGMNAFVSDDVEFYHDRGGSLIGKAALSAVNNGMTTMKNHLRRVAVPGTVHVFLMRKGEDVYGAVVTGEHQFYVIPKGKPEFLAGTSYFTQLMTLNGKEWKITRIFSYEHVNAAPSLGK